MGNNIGALPYSIGNLKDLCRVFKLIVLSVQCSATLNKLKQMI
jgi:hypothetical protein